MRDAVVPPEGAPAVCSEAHAAARTIQVDIYAVYNTIFMPPA